MDRIASIAHMAAVIVAGRISRDDRSPGLCSPELARAAVLMAENIYDLAVERDRMRGMQEKHLAAMPATVSDEGRGDGSHSFGSG